MFRKLDSISDQAVLMVILVAAMGTSVVSLLMSTAYGLSSSAEWWVGWLQNIGSEMLGAFVTFMLIHLLVGGREEKGRLIRQMRIRDNALAVQAVEELRAKGWLSDGSLDGANLMNTDLHGVRLRDAQLKGADLHGANLRDAKLERVNFSGANLWSAEFRGAAMKNVNLEGADLFHADLRGVKMIRVEFDEDTRLPDGSRWAPDTDLARFTNPDHVRFWDVATTRGK